MSKTFPDDSGDLIETPITPPMNIPPNSQAIDNPDTTKKGVKEKEDWPEEEPESDQ